MSKKGTDCEIAINTPYYKLLSHKGYFVVCPFFAA